MKDYIRSCQKFHEMKYHKLGDNYQRKYPDENVIKFAKKFLKKKSRLLDLGSGNGRNSLFLINEGHHVDVLDFSRNALNITKKKIKKKINFYYDYLPDLSKVKKKYTAIIDCFTSYALTQNDFKIYLNNIAKKINKNGFLHIQILSKNSDLFKKYKPAKKIEKYSLKSIERKNSPFPDDKYLFTFYNINQIKKELRKNKFYKINIEIYSKTYRNTNEYFEYFVINCQKK
jgi:cyclopropane fatty-acyl-phospholipid synthase-like methyltransferase